MKQESERIARIGKRLGLAGIFFGVLGVLSLEAGSRIGWSEDAIAASAFGCFTLASTLIGVGFVLHSAYSK